MAGRDDVSNSNLGYIWLFSRRSRLIVSQDINNRYSENPEYHYCLLEDDFGGQSQAFGCAYEAE